MDMRKYLIPNSSAKDSTTQNDLLKNEEKSENKEKLKTEIKAENKETLKNEEKSDNEEKYQPSANFSFPYHKIYGKNRCAQNGCGLVFKCFLGLKIHLAKDHKKKIENKSNTPKK